MSLYTATGLAQAAGVSFRQIDHWTTQGALEPISIKGASEKGTGNARIYDESALRRARGLSRLVGMSAKDAGYAVARAVISGRYELGHGFSLHYDGRQQP